MNRSGWVTFSAVVLIIAGISRIFDAIWAFRYNGALVDDLHQAILGDSLTVYGWLWLIVGIILIAAGLLLLAGGGVATEVSRWVGIAAAALGAITAVFWLPYYPVWSLIYIGLGVGIVYGLLTQNSESANR
jgi:sulfite exporter TauE/SafE